MSEPLIIIGQGMAGTKLAEELSQRALGRYSIIVIGDEPHRGYNRVLLSSLLAGEVEADEIELKPRNWWRDQGITNIFGQRVSAIDPGSKVVRLEGGRDLAYSKLVLATGSHAVKLPVPGIDLPGVITFRWMGDVDTMVNDIEAGQPAVVIGGGLLGLEAAYGLAKAGVKVTLLHLASRLMERQLDEPAAVLLRKAIEAKGCNIILEASTTRITGTDRAEAVELADGRRIPAALVVCAIGVRPNTDLARDAGLTCGRGIVVDDTMSTSAPDIFAIGECIEHAGIAYGLVEPAYEQARVLAGKLTGSREAAYRGTTLATNLKVSGVSLFSAGDYLGEGKEHLVFEDIDQGVYKKIVVEDGRLAGAVLYGDTSDGLWYLDLIKSQANIEPLRDMLIFGRAAADDPPPRGDEPEFAQERALAA